MRRCYRSLAASVAVLALVFAAAVPARAAAFVVINTNDSGPGSLRQAILDANANPNSVVEPDSIDFTIPAANCSANGVCTIAPLTPLPDITDPVIIDGYTQAGATPNANSITQGSNTVLKIELNSQGLVISAGDSTVRGLAFPSILLSTNGGNVIEGNFIGTDATGTVAQAGLFGVRISESADNTIGGTSPAARNIISGATRGVDISGFGGSQGNRVQGNFIGTDASGTTSLANGRGVSLVSSGVSTTIGGPTPAAGNIISGNVHGIHVESVVDPQLVIQHNLIGLGTGGVALGNNEFGIAMFEVDPFCPLNDGPCVLISENTIAFNGEDGIQTTTVEGMAILSNSIFSNGCNSGQCFGIGIELDFANCTLINL